MRVLLLLALGACATPAEEPLSALNWNTYLFFDHKAHQEEASAWLQHQDLDLVALQEVNGMTEATLQARAQQWGHAFVAMNKEHGYPVALTSREPIEVLERRVEGFHHGFLHARTAGLDVLVVHFWPTKTHEAVEVAAYAAALLDEGRAVIVMGDFNAPIRHDAPHFAGLGYEGENLDGEKRFDFRMTDAFLAHGFVDLVHAHSPNDAYSFSSPALIPRWRANLEEVAATRRRIDFVFADAQTAERVLDARMITNDQTVGQWADHYPMILQLNRPSAEDDA